MKLIPSPGMLFYVRVNPRTRKVILDNGPFGAQTIEKITEADGSWREDIFRAVAKDDTHIVALKLTGYREDKPMLLRIEDYTFTPVGPEVAKAMGFDTTMPDVQEPLDGHGS